LRHQYAFLRVVDTEVARGLVDGSACIRQAFATLGDYAIAAWLASGDTHAQEAVRNAWERRVRVRALGGLEGRDRGPTAIGQRLGQ
jgi:hypothetical protein